MYLAGFANHIGFYPLPSGMAEFASKLARYEHGKGSVQFPLDEPLPAELIWRIVRRRAEEDRKKAE